MNATARHPLPPPPWAFRFRSNDLGEIRAFGGGNDIPQSRVARQSKALGFDFYRVHGVRAAVGCSQVAAAQTVRGRVGNPVLHLVTPTGSVYRVGRRACTPTSQATAVFVAPGWDFSRSSPPGTVLAIQIDQAALLDELTSRQPRASGCWALRIESMVLAAAERAQLMAATADLLLATRPDTAASHAAHVENRLIAQVADLVLRSTAAAAAGQLSLARVNDLEGWIEAHLDEPLSLGRLCQVAGVGARCLQKAFESGRGMSPMRFVTERRLATAYARLSHGEPGTSVTRVAADLGFEHLGRFAQQYRQAIGETPSQTLAARGPDWAPAPAFQL